MTERSGHLDDARMHDFLDGELELGDERAVEDHLGSCVPCASRMAELASLVDDLGGLPLEASPARDLWPEVASRIADGAKVPALPARSGPVGEGAGDVVSARGRRGPRRVSFTVPQLWAAGIVVALLSGTTVWLALGGAGRAATDASVAAVSAEVARVDAPDVLPRTRVRTASAAYEQAVSDLEAILDDGRELLAPATVRTIEESLAAIDRAIAEAEEALARDPASDLLHRLLLQHRKTKLRVLRQATSGLRART